MPDTHGPANPSDPPALAALPVISDLDAMAYGDFTVRQHDDGQLEAIGDVPDRCAFARQLLESADHAYCSWDGKRITVTLANGSWSWDAEAQNANGTVVYGGARRGPVALPETPQRAPNVQPVEHGK